MKSKGSKILEVFRSKGVAGTGGIIDIPLRFSGCPWIQGIISEIDKSSSMVFGNGHGVKVADGLLILDIFDLSVLWVR